MRFKEFLSENRSEILSMWLESALSAYPDDTVEFLKNQKDRFRNPVGYALTEGLEGLIEELISGPDPEKVSSYLDGIIRIRAVQDIKPSEAVSFVFALKDVLREFVVGKEIEDLGEGLDEFISKIDRLGLLAFDIYSSCRERLFEVRTNELKRLTFRLIERANRILGEKELTLDDIRGLSKGDDLKN